MRAAASGAQARGSKKSARQMPLYHFKRLRSMARPTPSRTSVVSAMTRMARVVLIAELNAALVRASRKLVRPT